MELNSTFEAEKWQDHFKDPIWLFKKCIETKIQVQKNLTQ